jgi:hypothetical protein
VIIAVLRTFLGQATRITGRHPSGCVSRWHVSALTPHPGTAGHLASVDPDLEHEHDPQGTEMDRYGDTAARRTSWNTRWPTTWPWTRSRSCPGKAKLAGWVHSRRRRMEQCKAIMADRPPGSWCRSGGGSAGAEGAGARAATHRRSNGRRRTAGRHPAGRAAPPGKRGGSWCCYATT